MKEFLNNGVFFSEICQKILKKPPEFFFGIPSEIAPVFLDSYQMLIRKIFHGLFKKFLKLVKKFIHIFLHECPFGNFPKEFPELIYHGFFRNSSMNVVKKMLFCMNPSKIFSQSSPIVSLYNSSIHSFTKFSKHSLNKSVMSFITNSSRIVPGILPQTFQRITLEILLALSSRIKKKNLQGLI